MMWNHVGQLEAFFGVAMPRADRSYTESAAGIPHEKSLLRLRKHAAAIVFADNDVGCEGASTNFSRGSAV